MSPEKYISLEELVSKLDNNVRDLKVGKLSTQEIIDMHSLSRNLYERITVLRYNALETFSQKGAEGVDLIHPEIDEESEKSQTDLISSIEEVTGAPPKKANLKVRSLAESLQSSPLNSIGEGLTIVDRANFTSTLFSNDNIKFNDMLDLVDQCNNIKSAEKVFNSSMKTRGTSNEIEEALDSFNKRINRRFQS
ncbi:MAG: hypothetical protein H8E97_07140 [Bacteroidetes bacterium]|jgi:hypothetical protein|nr:hypothetical protein [Bacteroidota bacterium]MDA0731638.1 hypothetical protein [Bacteroidota bacterium]MDA0980400.1 hypothetical protein [Bacteroidota bacterium]